MVDNESSADIIYLLAFQQMKLSKERLRPFTSPLVSFTRDRIIPKGVVKLTIIASTYPAQVSKEIDFLVVDCPSTYNIILERATLNKLKGDINLLSKGEIPYNPQHRGNQKRPSPCKEMLSSHPSVKEESYVDDRHLYQSPNSQKGHKRLRLSLEIHPNF